MYFFKKLINYNSKTTRCVTRRGRWGRPALPFFENWKKVPNFWKKCPGCDHLWVKFLIWNAICKSFQGENQIFFPCRAFLFRFVHDCLSRCLNSKKTPQPKKFLVMHLNYSPNSKILCAGTSTEFTLIYYFTYLWHHLLTKNHHFSKAWGFL